MAARIRAVIWAASARDALDEVTAYIAQDSHQAAVRILETALEAAERLATFSGLGRVVPELNDATVREVFVHQYRLLYHVENERVVVVAFLHGARDFAKWQQDEIPNRYAG